MKAVGFQQALPISEPRSLVDVELPMPAYGEHDLLVEVHAVSVNPVDVKVRASATVEQGQWRILGWDAVGKVHAKGDKVTGFAVGDRVFYAGAINRQGSNAQFQAVDARIVGHAPQTLADEQAVALPLTALTAWEALFERLQVQQRVAGAAHAIVIIGGAGGVGSLMIQLARARTDLTVIASAARPQSSAWVRQMGAHHVIDHSKPLAAQVAGLGVGAPAFVFSTAQTDRYLADIVELIAAQGRIALIDDPATLDIVPLKRKSLSVHWELMFTRPLFQTADLSHQQNILNAIAALADARQITTTHAQTIGTINAANLRKAHALIESGRTVGKIVLAGW